MTFFADKAESEVDLYASDSPDAIAYFRRMADAMPHIVWQTDEEGQLIFVNSLWTAFTGVPAVAAFGEGYRQAFHPEDLEAHGEAWIKADQNNTAFEAEVRLWNASERVYHWHLIKGAPVHDASGRITSWIGTCTDIEPQKRLEFALRERVDEVEQLNVRLRRAMQETHHRVKNNLQVIAALAEMQLAHTEVAAQSALRRVEHHVRALALLHDMLTRSSTDAATTLVSGREMLEELVAYLQSSLVDSHLTYEADDVQLLLSQSPALSLVIYELVTNAIKHGGKNVRIELCRDGGNSRLEVMDDGPGFPEEVTAQTIGKTGFEILRSVVQWDLRGHIHFRNEPEGGACVVVLWPGR